MVQTKPTFLSRNAGPFLHTKTGQLNKYIYMLYLCMLAHWIYFLGVLLTTVQSRDWVKLDAREGTVLSPQSKGNTYTSGGGGGGDFHPFKPANTRYIPEYIPRTKTISPHGRKGPRRAPHPPLALYNARRQMTHYCCEQPQSRPVADCMRSIIRNKISPPPTCDHHETGFPQ